MSRHVLYVSDARKLLLPAADVIFYDPPYQESWAYRHIPAPEHVHQALLLAWDFRRFAVAPAAALTAGWIPHWEFIWDNAGAVWRPGEPGQAHKAIGLFSGGSLRWNQEHGKIVDYGKPRAAERKMTSVYRRAKTSMPTSHPHAKPDEWLAGILSGIGAGTMLDMFAGSGAGLFACEQLGMTWTGIEIDPDTAQAIADEYQEVFNDEIQFIK